MPLRDRPLFGILALIAFLLATYGLVVFGSPGPLAALPQITVVGSLIFTFTAAILLAWLALDRLGGVAMTALSIAVAWHFDLRTGFYGSPFFLLQYISASVIGYALYLARTTVARAAAVGEEKMQAEMNTLTAAIDDRTRNIAVLQKKLVRYAALKGVVESMSTVLSPEELYGLVLDKAVETIGKKGRTLLYLVDVDKQELMLVASRNESRIKAKKGDIFDQWVLRHRRSLIVEDVARDFRFPTGEAERAAGVCTSLVAAPLMGEDKVIGILRVDSPAADSFAQDDLRLLDIIANLGAVAIQNVQLYARTQELAIHDGLTGLFVRRHFLERFSEELKRLAGRQGGLAVFMIDIDHFKQYNDRYGHTAGDIVLKHLARVLSTKVREGDIVARYGGEELAVVILGRTEAQATAEAEAIRRAVCDEPFDLRRHRTRITVSIGVARYPEDATTEEGLLACADERLYRAKREGRNRVCTR